MPADSVTARLSSHQCLKSQWWSHRPHLRKSTLLLLLRSACREVHSEFRAGASHIRLFCADKGCKLCICQLSLESLKVDQSIPWRASLPWRGSVGSCRRGGSDMGSCRGDRYG